MLGINRKVAVNVPKKVTQLDPVNNGQGFDGDCVKRVLGFILIVTASGPDARAAYITNASTGTCTDIRWLLKAT
jgi:hypothetical protein